MRLIATLLLCIFLSACFGMPESLSPVKGFELDRYLGKWYEIARLDHPFERGLEQVTAEYGLREDGGVSVINRGFSPEDNEWQVSEGRGYLLDDDQTGHLAVSFFAPFYGSYVIFELDQTDYQYAFISGPNLSYLWLLSRQKTLPDNVIDRFVQLSAEKGFNTESLIFVKHDIDNE